MVLWVYVDDQEAKTGWRNLVAGGSVAVLLRRRWRTGTASALRADQDPRAVADGLRRSTERFPRTAKRLGLPAYDPAGTTAPSSTVLVRIELEDDREG